MNEQNISHSWFSLKENDCVVDVLLKNLQIHPCKDCGKCVFGYEGVTQLEMIIYDITQKKGRSSDIILMKDLCEQIKHQSMCEKGEELADMVLYGLSAYGAILEEHIVQKVCKACVCSKFVTYHILADKCIGCMECIDVCDDDAIMGKKKFIHVIDQEECTQCGECLKACEEGAIVKAGPVKPRCPQKPIPCKR